MNEEQIRNLYSDLGGVDFGRIGGGTRIDAPVFRTDGGTAYLKEPGVAILAQPSLVRNGLEGFLVGLGDDRDYMNDPWPDEQLGTLLAKWAGQLCYLSFGAGRTKNADAAKYFSNILSEGHGSVLEHPSYSFLFYGVSRSFTHELVRHRAGCAYSQVSQRYVSKPRFVERKEFQADPDLHKFFVDRIDDVRREYDAVAELLMAAQSSGSEILSGEKKTDLRKKVNQAARELLPNETEAPILFSANLRALRHIISMRANPRADVQIREVFFRVFLIMAQAEPVLFQDAQVVELKDGTYGVSFAHPKV